MALPDKQRESLKKLVKNKSLSPDWAEGYESGYDAGATDENERAQGLVEDIQLMLDQFALNPEESWFEIAHKMKGIGLDALRRFKDGKGKEYRPCPHCGKELSRDRNLCCRECGKEVENG